MRTGKLSHARREMHIARMNENNMRNQLRARVDQLRAENAELREQLAAAESRLHEVASHCANVEQQLAAAERDAERYRYLKTFDLCFAILHWNRPETPWSISAAPGWEELECDAADKVIDAARKEKP